MNKLAARVSTGIVGGAILFTLLVWSLHSHFAVFGVITFFCLLELANMFAKGADIKGGTWRFELILGGMSVYVCLSGFLIFSWPPSILLIPLLVLFLLFLAQLRAGLGDILSRLGGIAMGMIYPSAALAVANKLSFLDGSFDPWPTISTLILVFAHDTFAYFGGKNFGKRPLFKRISPNKTWEGSICGFFGAAIVSLILSQFVESFEIYHWIGMAGIVYIFGTLGDLFESLLKRTVDLKDSGSILPGHGGFLDRFDALVFVLPFILGFLIWL